MSGEGEGFEEERKLNVIKNGGGHKISIYFPSYIQANQDSLPLGQSNSNCPFRSIGTL
jgi:hypothetical protein